jgi:hypothetical protein
MARPVGLPSRGGLDIGAAQVESRRRDGGAGRWAALAGARQGGVEETVLGARGGGPAAADGSARVQSCLSVPRLSARSGDDLDPDLGQHGSSRSIC